jgi:hypothetical protein
LLSIDREGVTNRQKSDVISFLTKIGGATQIHRHQGDFISLLTNMGRWTDTNGHTDR